LDYRYTFNLFFGTRLPFFNKNRATTQ